MQRPFDVGNGFFNLNKLFNNDDFPADVLPMNITLLPTSDLGNFNYRKEAQIISFISFILSGILVGSFSLSNYFRNLLTYLYKARSVDLAFALRSIIYFSNFSIFSESPNQLPISCTIKYIFI